MTHQETDRTTSQEVAYASTYQEAVQRGVPLRDADGTVIYPSFGTRPPRRYTLDLFHRGLYAASIAMVIVASVGFAMWWAGAEDQVPMHYNAAGEVTRYGSPNEALLPYLLSLGAFVLCAALGRFPRIFNFPFQLTEENIQRQYKNAEQMMIWLCAGMALIPVSMAGEWAGWFGLTPLIWFAMAAVLLPVVVFTIRMYRIR